MASGGIPAGWLKVSVSRGVTSQEDDDQVGTGAKEPPFSSPIIAASEAAPNGCRLPPGPFITVPSSPSSSSSSRPSDPSPDSPVEEDDEDLETEVGGVRKEEVN